MAAINAAHTVKSQQKEREFPEMLLIQNQQSTGTAQQSEKHSNSSTSQPAEPKAKCTAAQLKPKNNILTKQRPYRRPECPVKTAKAENRKGKDTEAIRPGIDTWEAKAMSIIEK